MSSANLHTNMFPHAGETGMQRAADATDADVAGITAAAVPASAWGNPASSLQRFGAARADEQPPQTKRQTVAERVIAYLREHGPTASSVLREAFGLNKDSGITPYVGNALKAGQIVRVGGQYGLPGQFDESQLNARRVRDGKQSPAAEPASVSPEQNDGHEATAGSPAPAPAVDGACAESETATGKPPGGSSQRTPEFTLTVDDAMLLSWPDGSATVQRGGSFVELSPEQMRMFRMHCALR